MQVDTKKKWEKGMKEEMDSLVNNQTWDLVQFPGGKRALQNKWVYKLKEEYGGKKWYKDRLVVKGFSQNKGIDFDEIKENRIPKVSKNQNVQQQEQNVPQTPTSVVIISTRLSRPHERYSPSLYYLLLTNSGEPESYEEEMQVDIKRSGSKAWKRKWIPW